MNYVHIKGSLGSADLRTVEFDVENFLEFTTIFETTFLKSSLCLSVCLSVSVCLSLSDTHHTHYKIGSFDVLLFLPPPHNLHSKNHGYISRSKFKEINCEHLCRSNLGAFYPRISTINFGKLFYFYNLHIEGYFYSKNHAFIL